MDETDYLAKVCANIIKAQGLTKDKTLITGAKVITLLAESAQIKEVDTARHLQQTDSVTYKTVDKKMERVVAEEAVLPPLEKRPVTTMAKAGGQCVCKCGKVLYNIVQPITDPMPLKAFIDAFEPVGHAHRLNEKMKLQNIDGNVVVDCMVCGADFGVCLIGSFAGVKTLNEQGGVASVAGGDIESVRSV